ncbi:MAG: hypothetical protein FWH16_02770 [Oscillospiraceae bacterium]|nr:hypothetical protein [Oscillospiraceae bacterium]
MGDWIIGFLNGLIESIGSGINSVFSGIPDLCPFHSFQNTLDNELLATLNWFVPISEMIVMLELWLVAIALWYVVSIALRWFKAIQ